ncbi:M43 family zinc metalloprotease [Chitinophagaceae bacterium LB-8]|uniref:M43 family zinc metalloprotease n=1 Tax=Paraflavisolibacter caeni TaxID=2982496 RepID=A0A9X2XN93_9BACT|nr:M43 family zinc metalloprotease [Paraflavisolibacter caeni]MCU7548323.1 M43 family zinc metalloprotease [Paraflavisolibacter caeni]
MRALHLSCFLLLLFHLLYLQSPAQTRSCATMDVLTANIKKAPTLQKKFADRRALLQTKVNLKLRSQLRTEMEGTYTIPVVFHVVLQNQNTVTDAQIKSQLDTLNKTFGGSNADSVKIPSYFKSLFGHSSIRFCLAQRTPEGDPTSGIVRYTAGKTSFTVSEDVKYSSSGGADSWNTAKYLNIWICRLSNGVLGYSTFPETSSAVAQGVVIDYTTLPGGSASGYNRGKTLVHETGHYFDLYHIWGDDDGACTGSDDVDDTPNQRSETTGCPSGIKTDQCTTTSPGIMYQNYMDYTNDDCMVMFTANQVARIETSLINYRSSLLSSNGCVPVVQKNKDAMLVSITQPATRICANTFTPKVIIKNKGIEAITSFSVSLQLNNEAPQTTSFTQNLVYNVANTISLPEIIVPEGSHSLKIYISGINGTEDENHENDTLTQIVEFYYPVTKVTESFEGKIFPPAGWDIVNPDKSYTWQKTTDAAKTGTASVVVQNFNYEQNGQKDLIRLPLIDLSGADSAFLSFQLAAAVQTTLTTTSNVWDTLEVLVSTDCSNSYKSLYKKWGSSLATTKTPVQNSFIPSSDEWRKDSVNLTDYIPYGNVMLAIANTTEWENNVYIDDINLNKVTVNPYLKKDGFLVSPNPSTTGIINVDFYPQPTNLRGIAIYNAAGQVVVQQTVTQNPNNHYQFDLSRLAKGIYIVKVVFTDRTLVKKVMME